MATWQEILAGNADMEVSLSDGSKLKLSDLRSGLEEVNRKILEQKWNEGQQALAAERARIESEGAQVREMYQRVLAAQEAAANQTARPAPNAEGVYDYSKDEYAGPIWKDVQEQKAQIAQLAQAYQQMIASYAQREVDRALTSIKDIPEGLTKEQILRGAIENKLVDRWGLPDVEASFSRLTESQRTEKMKKEAEEAGYKKAMNEAGMGHIGRPSPVPVGGEPAPKPKFKDFTEAFNAARQDASLFMPRPEAVNQ